MRYNPSSTMAVEHDELQLEEGLLTGIRKVLPRSPIPWSTSATTVALCTVAVFGYLIIHVQQRSPYRQQLQDHSFIPSQRSAWAQYAPYTPADEYQEPPEGCTVVQVNILQRHGARYPTEGATTKILAALGKVQSASSYSNPHLKFLKDYEYGLGTDEMPPYGAGESFKSGVEAYQRYWPLINEQSLPFIRSDVSQRDVDSASNWTAGLSAASHHNLNPSISYVTDVAARNNTLDGSQCPAAGRGEEQTDKWLETYFPKITAQLNSYAAGANLNNVDTYNLVSLCPFESLAYLKKSPWCTLFEDIPGAFAGFEYMGDLDKFYKTGYGQPLGPVQGVGYINELLARLTGSPVHDQTQTNHTLDDFADTFPLNRTFYLDFSHDNQMIAIFSAMGLFHQPRPLDPIRPDPNRTWRVSTIVPFAGRMVVEKLECPTTFDRTAADVQEMVRILVQDKIQPLDFCGADNDGLCTLDTFVESQSYARNNGEGDWEKCFELV